jgi:hypothetical protein
MEETLALLILSVAWGVIASGLAAMAVWAKRGLVTAWARIPRVRSKETAWKTRTTRSSR